MELTNEFRVGVPVEQAWAVLTDLERIAPCMPGAQLQEVEGDVYRGVVKVKVGPITTQYKGQASFLERNDTDHVAVLRAEGRETRGQGNANATITARLTPDGDGTVVSVVTDLTVTGRVAQFGRGVLADVSANLLDQFVERLEQTVLVDLGATPSAAEPSDDDGQPAEAAPPVGEADDAPHAPAPEPSDDDGHPAEVTSPVGESDDDPHKPAPAPAARPAVRTIDSPEPTPVDLVGAAGSPVAKRVGPVLALLAVAWVLKKLLSRNKS